MSNPVFEDSFAVYVDNEIGNELITAVAGPAGSAFLRLPTGVTIEVDYAQPEQLIALYVEPHAAPSLLATLIGDERAQVVARFTPREDGRPYRLPDRRIADFFDDRTNDAALLVDEDEREREHERERLQSLPLSLRNSRNAYETGLLGRLAVLQTVAMDPAMSDLAQATASLEFAASVSSGELLRIPGLAELLEPSVERAGELLAGVRTEMRALVQEQPHLADQLHKLCARFGTTNDGCASAARLLAEARRSRDGSAPSWHEAGRRYAPAAPPDGLLAMRSRPHADAMAAIPAPELAASLRSVPDHTVSLAYGGRLTVRSMRPRPDEWLRVLHASTLALVALAPLLEDDDGDWGAEALIPTDLGLADIALEITPTPLPTESMLVRTREAIRLGRDAVLTSARGNAFRTRELWRLTAAAWEEVGDETRSRLAREYSMQSPKSRRSNSLAEQMR